MSYYGDEHVWFLGRVVSTADDPLALGRAKVRIHGVHGPNILDDDLPWAAVVLPTTGGGISGFGTTPWLQTGARVFGIFLDGHLKQSPLITGTVPSIEGAIVTSPDPSANYAGGAGPNTSTSSNYATRNTNFHGTNSSAEEAVAAFYRPLPPQEFNTLMAIVNAESSQHLQEQAWVAGVVLNRARYQNKTVMQIVNQPWQFEPVTGTRRNPGPRPLFTNGPGPANTTHIYTALTENLSSVPNNVFFFDSNNPGAWGGRRDGRMAEVAQERQSAGLTLRVIGQTRFWLGYTNSGLYRQR